MVEADMANPYPVGSDQYYEEEARQNAAKGQAMDAAVQATAPTQADAYRVGGGGSGQGPAAPAITQDMTGGAQGGGSVPGPAPVSAPVQSPPAAPATASGIVMMGGQGQPQQAAPVLPGPDVMRGGGAARVIPGGRAPQSWQVTQETGHQYSPELMGNIDAANEQEKRAAELERTAAQDTLAAQSEVADKRTVFDAQERQRRALEEDARLNQERAMKARVDALRDINPSAAWDNKSGFQKAMTMIAAGLAGAAAGLRGDGHNPVLEQLQREAEQDTRLQLKKLDDASGELKDFYAQYPTFQAKLAAGTALRLEDFQRQNESLFTGAKNQLVVAQGLANASKLQEKQNELRMKMEEKEQGKEVVARHDVMVAPKVVGGGGSRFNWGRTMEAYAAKGGDLETAAKEINLIKSAGKLTDDEARLAFFRSRAPDVIVNGPAAAPGAAGQNAPGSPATFVPSAFGGKGGFATSLEGAKTANTVADMARQFHETTQELIKLRGESGSTIPGSDQRNRADAVLANRFRLAKEIAQTGAALSEAEITNMVNPLANMDALDLFSTDARTLARIQMSDDQINNMAQSKIANAGVVPGSLQARGGQLQGKVTGSPGALVAPGTVRFNPAGGGK
jgi:hypothetical protein